MGQFDLFDGKNEDGTFKPRIPIAEATDKNLEYWRGKTHVGIEKNPQGQYAPRDRITLKAIEEEQERRRGGGQRKPASKPRNPTPQRQQSQAIAPRREAGPLTRTFHTAKMFSEELARVDEYNIIGPSTVCAAMPPGFSGAIAYIHVDTNTEKDGPGDVYRPKGGGGRLGLSKTVLGNISNAVGVSWCPERSRRLDDGSHPHYCRYRVVGTVIDFDGTERLIFDEKEMDLRDGSAAVKSIMGAAKNEEGGETQVREQRTHIVSHAITKARLRAIRGGLGLKTGYTEEELEKPFAVAKVMWTAHSDDPELARTFAIMGAAAKLKSSRAAFGPPAAAPQLAAAPVAPQLAPPPIDPGRPLDDDDRDWSDGDDGGGQ